MISFRFHFSLPALPKSHTLSPNSSRFPTPCWLFSTPAFAISSSGDAGLRFREKILFLERSLGVDSSRALSLNPDLRSASLSSLQYISSLLASYGLTPADSARLLTLHPSLLTADPDASFLPVFRFLLGPVSIPLPELRLSINRCPRLLLSSVPNRLLPSFNFLRTLGFVGHHHITARTTVLLVSDVEKTLIPKLDFLQSLGFSYKDTATMVLRCPGLLTFSIENNFRPKLAFLLGGMGRKAGELKKFPHYFAYSLAGRIKPRHMMLVDRGFDSTSIPLGEMLKASDGEFRELLLDMRLRLVGEKL